MLIPAIDPTPILAPIDKNKALISSFLLFIIVFFIIFKLKFIPLNLIVKYVLVIITDNIHI